MLKDQKIAAVIPAYNEAQSIRDIAEQVLAYTPHVIVVDDGSTDETAERVADLPVHLIRHTDNQGKAQSLLRGFQHAKTLGVTGVISIDADTQHNPADIPAFLHATQHYPDHIIIGARLKNREHAPKSRRRANQVADFFISWAAGHPVLDTQSGYRLYPMRLIETCVHDHHQANFVFESEILVESIRKGFRPAILSIQSHYPKTARKSHFRPIADTSKIALMLMWKITSRGMCLPSLFRSLSRRKLIILPGEPK